MSKSLRLTTLPKFIATKDKIIKSNGGGAGKYGNKCILISILYGLGHNLIENIDLCVEMVGLTKYEDFQYDKHINGLKKLCELFNIKICVHGIRNVKYGTVIWSNKVLFSCGVENPDKIIHIASAYSHYEYIDWTSIEKFPNIDFDSDLFRKAEKICAQNNNDFFSVYELVKSGFNDF